MWSYQKQERKVQLLLLSFTLGWPANWRLSKATLKHCLYFSVSLSSGSFFIQEGCFSRNEDFDVVDHFITDKVLPNLLLRTTSVSKRCLVSSAVSSKSQEINFLILLTLLYKNLLSGSVLI